jgi:serine/threonine protein kinase/WD40 repeat protein/tetratricopeptide (TPR) repeat protein
MNPNKQQIDSIFLAAAEKATADERAAYLDGACGTDTELRERVERLLAAQSKVHSFLEAPPAGLGATMDQKGHEVPGTVIGPYKLLEQIGEGGFGVVFMAEQTQPVRRKVALKVVKPGMDTRQIVARFEAERQALALMDHPNIAHVFDGGQTAAGRPYFVMELVKGMPITDYCDQCQLTPRQRLKLFLPVCQAVQHAHQKGIIHRDLKPSNVLVTLHDGTPVVKVIDFGIAKATGQQLTEKTLFTNFAQLIGTPLYMSPEQAALSGLDVDTRSDIYSLGVLLYELLTGTTPFDKERLRTATFDEIRRIIREEEPPKPSTRISTLGQAAATLSTQRKSDPNGLSQLFRGELDWIVMKCLDKDRNRRYETASALARDIERYLHDEPVQACPPSAAYRFRKFARRHRTVLATSTLMAGVLVLGTVVSVWLAVRAIDAEGLAAKRLVTEAEARQAADTERDRAKRRLFDARLAQARAARWSGRAGQRFDGLAALTEAARLAHELDLGPEEILKLRNEAIACMALVDLRLDQKWPAYPAGSTLTGIAFDRNMQHYARVDSDGNIVVRRLADNQETLRITDIGAPASPRRQPDWRVTLLFSPDGQFLAASGRSDDAAPLQVWDLRGAKSLMKGPPAGGFDRTIDFSPDSRFLAARAPDHSSIVLYDVLATKELKHFWLSQPIFSLRFHPRRNEIAVCSGSQVHVLDLDGRPMITPLSHHGRTLAVSWSADGRLLAVACEDRQAYVWNVRNSERQAICNCGLEGVIHVAFSQHGDLLATVSPETTRLWDPRTGKELLSSDGPAAEFSRDDRWLGLGVFGSGVGRWEVATGGEYGPLYGHSREAVVSSLDISPDGRLLASAANDGVRLWDMAAGKTVATLPIGRTYSVIFDQAGRFLITSSASGLHRWPIRPQTQPFTARFQVGPPELIRLPRGQQKPKGASVSADGRTLAVCQNFGPTVIFDLDQANAKPRLIHHPVTSLAVSPDGKWLATNAMEAYEGKLWDVQTGKWVRDFPGMRSADPVFSPDKRWLVFATAREYLFYRVGSWQPGPRVPRDSAGYLLGPVAFSRDGKMAAVGYTPRLIRLIDAESGRELATLAAPVPEQLRSLCFTPDGSRLLAGTANGVIQLWDVRRIREQLRAIGLDWDPPADRPTPPTSPASQTGDQKGAIPLHVELHAGELLDREKYNLILAFFPFHAEAYYRRGLAEARLQQWQQACQDFTLAIALQADYAEAHWQRGRAYGASGESRKAIADYSHFLALMPPGDQRRAEVLLRRAGNYQRLNDHARALTDLQPLVQGDLQLDEELHPAAAMQFNNMAWRYVTGPDKLRDPNRALSFAKKAVELTPGEWMYLNTLGVVYYRLGRYPEALETLERSLRKSDAQAAAFDLFFLAMCHARRGDRDRARDCYDRAVQWVQQRRGNLSPRWSEELAAFRAEAAELLGVKKEN